MAIFFLFVCYVALEIYVFIEAVEVFGFINVVFALLVAGVLGIGIVRNQGRYVLTQLQQSVARGLVPQREVLHGVALLLGGFLLIVPGFVSDFLAFLLLLPGTRHLLVYLSKGRLKNGMKNGTFSGNFRVFTFGNQGSTRPTSGAGSGAQNNWARDVSPSIIDVTPVSSQRKEEP